MMLFPLSSFCQPTLPAYPDLGRDRQRRIAAQSTSAAAAMATSMNDAANCPSCDTDLAAEMEQREYERRLMEQYADADGRICTCDKCQVGIVCEYGQTGPSAEKGSSLQNVMSDISCNLGL